MSWLFKLRGDLKSQQRISLSILGLIVFVGIWVMLTMGANPIITSGILPSPWRVLTSYPEMCADNDLIKNTAFSVGLNLAGYLKAIFYSLLIGFIIGLYPLFRGMFQNQLDGIRFLPLAAATSIFIIWFGTGVNMKVNFLSFGILIFLLPVVVQRIDEVKDVYLKTVHTLGASDWQIIKTVYIPSVISRLFDDVRILTAISWTYIVVAESLANQGGIGALTFAVRRFGRMDKLFALLLLIIFIGIIQDQIFKYLDKEFFPHKYQTKSKYSDKLEEPSLFDVVLDFSFNMLIWISIIAYMVLVVAEYFPILEGVQPLSYLFQDTIWAIHAIFVMILLYKGNTLIRKFLLKEDSPKKIAVNG